MATLADDPDNPRVLLVEGRDDERVIRSLERRLNLNLSFTMIVREGVSQLLESIPIDIRSSGREVVGIVVDANDHADRRWQAVRDGVVKASIGLALPDRPAPLGTIIEGRPRLGVWLMPDNESAGELEDFVATMIPENDDVRELAEKYIDGIPGFRGKRTRAVAHAWLAGRGEGRPMGTAIRAGDLNAEGELAGRFARWLEELFR